MAKQRRITLSPKLAQDVKATVTRVLGEGQSNAVTPYEAASVDRWMKIKIVNGGAAPYVYTVDLYTSPYSATPISAGLAKARSVMEIGGSGGPVEVDTWHKVIGKAVVDDQLCFLFSPGGGDSLPSPQYQYMVIQGVTDNQLGADWTRGHDLP